MEQNILGGWSKWNFAPTYEAARVFEDSVGKLLGVKYKLVAFASQLVNGTNYAFLCEAETATLPGSDYIVIAYVHQPIKGVLHITGFKPVGPKPAHIPGGWQNWQFAVTGRAKSVFDEALKHLHGVKYKPLAFAEQLVAGTNYCFLTEATAVVEKPFSYPALVFIYQPLYGPPHIESIQRISPVSAQIAETEEA